MKSLLNRMSIIQLTLVSSAILTLFIFTLLIPNLSTKWHETVTVKQDIALISLLDALEKVAHNHAVERGLTAGFLGSGSDAARNKVIEQRRKADASIQNLRRASSELNLETDTLEKNLNILFQHDAGKSALRSQVDQQNAPGAFAFYSTLNKIALDLAANLKNQIKHPELAESLSAAFLLAQYKERLGQNRGKINGALARKALPASAQRDIASYTSELSLLNKYLSATLHGSLASQFSAILRDSNSQQINDIKASLLALSPDFTSLPEPGVWFPMATKQIGKIKGLLDKEWQEIRDEGTHLGDSARTDLPFTIIAFLIALFVIFILNSYLYTSLKKELHQLTKMLTKAEKGDLTVDIRLNTRDELGKISNAIHNTIYAFKDLMLGLDKSVKSGSILGDKMNAATKTVLDGSFKTQSMATNIATAIEEMAATSREIAESASSTLEASDQLNK